MRDHLQPAQAAGISCRVSLRAAVNNERVRAKAKMTHREDVITTIR